tara:strand:+ start:99 stop:407 length:309 start_codon:yes stop_codon:yes gene_type:complete
VEVERVLIASKKCGSESGLGSWVNVLVGIVSDIKNLIGKMSQGDKTLLEDLVKIISRFGKAVLVGEEAERFSESEIGEGSMQKGRKEERGIELCVRDNPERE